MRVEASRRRRRVTIVKIAGFSCWMGLVALFLLWEATSYRGLMSLVGEWQFNAFGRMYPTFNYLLLVILLCLPGYLIFFRPRKRTSAERETAATLRSGRAFFRAVSAIVAGLLVMALVVLIAMMFLPGDSGESQRIDLASPVISPPREGPVTISGVILYERTAGLDENLLLARHSFRFAPIVSGRAARDDVQFFIQMAPVDEHTRAGATTVTGVLKRDALPGSVVRLFRYAGFHIAEPHYVIFTEPSAMRWPYLITLAQLVLAGLLALVIALLQRRRVDRIDDDAVRQPGSEVPVA